MSKTLVVYYSATGQTERVAKIAAEKLGADLFELQPATPYSEADFDWTDLESRVSKEHNDESLRDIDLVQETPENWDEYDTVLIGCPIWYGIFAWPVNRFMKINSFADKTVVPFCVSHSSPLGDSDKLLHEMTSSGDWKDGYRFAMDPSEEEIDSWLKGLGL